MKWPHRLFGRYDTLLVAAAAVIVAGLAIAHSYAAGTIMAYGDAESHINIAKRVIDGLTPGLGQLGGVWLPLHHLLMVPFVANDFMWRSGLGGSVVSGLSFVVATVFVYGLAGYLSGRKLFGLLGAVVFAANPNILYMLTTPMSELPLLALMGGSIYFFVRWMREHTVYDLVLAAAFVFVASLVRYDAWFLLFLEITAVGITGVAEKWHHSKTIGLLIVFTTLGAFGALLWLLWGQVIFHDPFYFMNSPYSAKSQQLAFRAAGELPSYHNVYESVRLYVGAVLANAGIVLSILAALGGIAYGVVGKGTRSFRVLVCLLLASPMLFNILSLVLGISILFVPGVTPESFRYQLFNIRYGLVALPAIAVFCALLPSVISKPVFKIGTSIAVTVAAIVFSLSYPITLTDGLHGLSARFPDGVSGVNLVFQRYYDHGDVVFDDFSRSANPVSLGIPMNRIIYVGSHPYWEKTLAEPNDYARWVIIRKDDALDRAFSGRPSFSADYTAVYSQADTTLYKCSADCHGWAE